MPLFSDAIASFRSRGTPQPSESAWLNWFTSTTGGSIELAQGLSASYTTIYQRQPYVFAAVNKIARGVARMPLKPYQQDGKVRRQVFDGPLSELMNRPMIGLTPFRLKEHLVKSTMCYGNGIIVKLGMKDDADTPTELMPSPAYGWRLGKGDTYIWTSREGKEFTFERWQIIHCAFYDLDDCGFGVSQLEPLRSTLYQEDAARRYGNAAFRNGARPGSVLKTDQKLKPETAAALRANMESIHGGPDDAFKIAVLEQGLEWVNPPASDLEEAAVVLHRKLAREEVASVLDVPQPAIGILDEANYNSIEILHTTLYQDSIGVWVQLIEETLQEDLIYRTPAFEGQYLKFNMNSVLRAPTEQRYRANATAITSGFKTPNEIRALEDDPPSDQPEADMLLFPMNLSGAVGAQLAEDTGQEDDTDDRA